MSIPSVGQLQTLPKYHTRSRMDAHQVQDYIDLVVSKGQSLGEHYIARQLEWAVVELELAGQTHSYDVLHGCFMCGGKGVIEGGKTCPCSDGVSSIVGGEE